MYCAPRPVSKNLLEMLELLPVKTVRLNFYAYGRPRISGAAEPALKFPMGLTNTAIRRGAIFLRPPYLSPSISLPFSLSLSSTQVPPKSSFIANYVLSALQLASRMGTAGKLSWVRTGRNYLVSRAFEIVNCEGHYQVLSLKIVH